jgi:N-methylhydantoinase A
VGSALGFFTAPRAFDLVRSHKVQLERADFKSIETLFQEMEREGLRTLRAAGASGAVTYTRSLEARFVGQGSETNLPLPPVPFTQLSAEELRAQFDEVYQRLYGRTYPDIALELVNFRVRASLPVQALKLPRLNEQQGNLSAACKGERPAYSAAAAGFISFCVYDRYLLFPGASFRGPAIIEERESTVIVGEDAAVSVDGYGFLWIELGQ